jgi:hypothetical protein
LLGRVSKDVSNGSAAPAGGIFISVAVPTCDRPEALERCLSSLARVRYPAWNLLVVDQSDGDETRRLAASYADRIPNLEYVQVSWKNASRARNLALARASGEVLAFLDDDCTVTSDWLHRVAGTFLREPAAKIVFGAVAPAHHDRAKSFIPAYEPKRPRRLSGHLSTLQVAAMGASMYLRLGSARPRLFDPCLGPGARFRGSQDWDYIYRSLLANDLVAETPEIVVTHHGVRHYSDGSASAKGLDYSYGLGASHAKLVRCGELVAVAMIVSRLIHSVAAIRPHRRLFGRPTNFGRIPAYLRGIRDSLRTPVDSHSNLFKWEPAPEGALAGIPHLHRF